MITSLSTFTFCQLAASPGWGDDGNAEWLLAQGHIRDGTWCSSAMGNLHLPAQESCTSHTLNPAALRPKILHPLHIAGWESCISLRISGQESCTSQILNPPSLRPKILHISGWESCTSCTSQSKNPAPPANFSPKILHLSDLKSCISHTLNPASLRPKILHLLHISGQES